MTRALLPLAVLTTAACDLATIDPTDSSAPAAEMLVNLGGGYQPMTDVDLSFGDALSLMCRVTDAQGVRRARLSFAGGVSDSCTTSSSVYTGSFPISPALDGPMEQTLSGVNGQVPTVLPLLYTQPDVACTLVGGEEGRPIGHDIVVTCEGGNWATSELTDTSTLTIHVK